jgi:glycogen(starch) synthase
MHLAKSAGIARSVTFAGWINPDKIPELINSSTVVLVPSRWREAFGLVALQAAQMARPVVATNTGGLAEIVADGETGLLVEKEDVKGFSNAISYLLDHPETARQMGTSAVARARETFSWEKHVNAFHALYQSVGAKNDYSGKSI